LSHSTKTLVKRTILVTGGRIALLALWFAAITMVYRQLGLQPNGLAQAGVLAFSLATIKMFTIALGDPLDMDVVRRVPPILNGDPQEAVAIWRAAQQIRIGLAICLISLGAIFARPLAELFLDGKQWSFAVFMAAVAASFELLYRGYLSDLQSRERFDRFLWLEACLQGVRLLAISGLWLSGGLNVKSFLIAYALSTFLVTIGAFAVSGNARRQLLIFCARTSRQTWQYVRWIAPAMILGAAVERFDLFMLSAIKGPDEGGLYGALIPLIMVPEVVIAFSINVLQPRISDLSAQGALLHFWASILKLTVPLALAGAIIAYFFAETIISLSIGPSYLASAPAFRLLFVAVMIWFAVVPVPMSYVVMTQPQTTLAITLVQAVVMLVVGWLAIPSYGAFGAALAVLLTRSIAAALICGFAYYLLKSPASKQETNPT